MQFNREVRVVELDYYIMHLKGLRKTMLMLSHATLAMFLSVALYINTVFALKFDNAKSIEWLKISAATLTVMSFIKIAMVWLLPRNFLGLAIIVMTVGFFVMAGACEAIITNSFGRSALGVCSYLTI